MGQLIHEPGHNNGPTMEAGTAWRTHCWSKARRELMPKLPIEILRSRVVRAKELGLDYTSYASIRASSGHDVVAFLFSSNALRVMAKSPDMPSDRMQKLATIKDCHRSIAVHRPLQPDAVVANLPDGIIERAFAAPTFVDAWGETRAKILAELQTDRLPRDGVVVIGDTSQERAWSEAARLAGYLNSEQFFGADTAR